MFLSVLIVCSTISLGWEVQYHAKNGHLPNWAEAVNALFCLIFVIELLMRMLMERSAFLLGQECHWNCFDTVVVSSSVLEEIAQRSAFQ